MDHLTPSSINTYENCGVKFYYNYIEGRPAPATIPMIVGSAVHKGIEYDLTNVIRKNEHVDINQLLDVVSHHYDDRLIEIEEGDKLKGKDNAIKMIKLWYNHFKNNYSNIKEVEKKISIEMVGIPKIRGRIDIVEEGTITDIKTGFTHKTIEDANSSTQLTIYSLAYLAEYGKLPNLQFDSITINSIQRIPTYRNADSLKATIKYIQQIWEAIQKGIFIPTYPDNPMCSKQNCEYWNICQYAKRKV